MRLSVELQDRNDRPYAVEGVELRVETFSFAAQGGPREARLRGIGDERWLWRAVEWLRYGVTIVDETREPRWWGFVSGVEISVGPYTFGVTLDSMANRIQIAYELVEPGQESTGERATTEWLEDAASVEAYGIKEALLTMSSATEDAALAFQRAALEIGRFPVPTLALSGSSEATLKVTCTGWWYTLEWRQGINAPYGSKVEGGGDSLKTLVPEVLGPVYGYAQRFLLRNAAAMHGGQLLLDKVGAPPGPLTIGLISDAGGGLGNVIKTVTLPASSVGALGWVTFTWDAPVAGEANTAYWLSVGVGGGELPAFQNAPGNYYRIQRALDQRGTELQTEVFQHGAWNDTAGSLFFRVLGSGGAVLEALEVSGSTQLTPAPEFPAPISGYFQSFIALGTVPYKVGAVELRLGKVGNPPGPLLISITQDSGNNVGAVMETVPLQAEDVSTDVEWTSITFGPSVELTPGQRYWLAVTQVSTGFDRNNTYILDRSNADIALSGDFRRYQGAVLPTTGELYYVVGGLVETTALAANILQTYGQFFTGVRTVDSGVYSSGYEDGDSSALDILTDLLEQGSARALRLLARVTVERQVEVIDEPGKVWPAGPRYYVDRDGTLRGRTGQLVPPAECPAGYWAQLKDVLPSGVNIGLIADPTLFFVEEAEFNVVTGRWTLTPRNQLTVWDLGG